MAIVDTLADNRAPPWKVADNRRRSGPDGDVEIIVPSKKRKGNFDDQKPPRRPFDTAVLRALATLSCTAPLEANWKNSDYTDVTEEDVFVAGFAYGESCDVTGTK